MRGDRRYLVKIEFDREFGRNVADTLWHATQRITWSRGVCVFECEVDGLDEILWWVLGYGHHARVLAPAELSFNRLRNRRLHAAAPEQVQPPVGVVALGVIDAVVGAARLGAGESG